MKRFISVFFMLLLSITMSGCSDTNTNKAKKQELKFVQVDRWDMKIWLPEDYQEETSLFNMSDENVKITFSNSDQKDDDYLLLDKTKLIYDNLEDLYFADACGVLYGEVDRMIEEETEFEWLTEHQSSLGNIPFVQFECCDNDYNFNICYYLNTHGEIIKLTHVHKKEGDDSPITYVFNDIAHNVVFSSEFQLHPKYPSSFSVGTICNNCAGLGFVKQYYGSSWLEALLAGEPNYELIKCPMCHGTGRT